MIMLEAIDWLLVLAIILFISGFVLIGIEMLAPGFSVPGLAGIVCLIIGIFLTADSFAEGIIITIILLVLLVIMFATIIRALAKGKIKSPIILKDELKKDKGYVSADEMNHLLGKRGVAATDLRPTGTGNFDGVDLDVISEGKYITKDTKLIIFKVQGAKLIVREDDEK